ncbi:Endonuclease YncB, thermonuclease family [Ruegeria intermedia]|uniref:Endonuclease YncB, thermonuclease family n=1 Tax=Ruegeria intermedia TaxID=996115 RepID=A0A1M4V896_9RHOB|nr:thermonuclease family protein [Ruegeria intermedia]SHE65110.1 Endonuclease YncB, thermonuclease family [Ruegeria intermedia]
MELVVLIGVAALLVVFTSGKPRSVTRRTGLQKSPQASARNRATRRQHPRVAPSDRILTGRAYVIDGDTIIVRGTKIRLAGIDAPELDMPWGQKAKWAMVEICKGQEITVKLNGETSYDRFVGIGYLPDGRDIGAELVKRGLALDLPFFSQGRYRHLEPAGARERLRNGAFGHASISARRTTTVIAYGRRSIRRNAGS